MNNQDIIYKDQSTIVLKENVFSPTILLSHSEKKNEYLIDVVATYRQNEFSLSYARINAEKRIIEKKILFETKCSYAERLKGLRMKTVIMHASRLHTHE